MSKKPTLLEKIVVIGIMAFLIFGILGYMMLGTIYGSEKAEQVCEDNGYNKLVGAQNIFFKEDYIKCCNNKYPNEDMTGFVRDCKIIKWD